MIEDRSREVPIDGRAEVLDVPFIIGYRLSSSRDPDLRAARARLRPAFCPMCGRHRTIYIGRAVATRSSWPSSVAHIACGDCDPTNAGLGPGWEG